jgi:hypothetical protein
MGARKYVWRLRLGGLSVSRNPGQGNFGPPDPKEFYAHLPPKTTRQYVPAVRNLDGRVVAIGRVTLQRNLAEIDCASRQVDDQVPVFVAFRDIPHWTPIEELRA